MNKRCSISEIENISNELRERLEKSGCLYLVIACSANADISKSVGFTNIHDLDFLERFPQEWVNKVKAHLQQ